MLCPYQWTELHSPFKMWFPSFWLTLSSVMLSLFPLASKSYNSSTNFYIIYFLSFHMWIMFCSWYLPGPVIFFNKFEVLPTSNIKMTIFDFSGLIIFLSLHVIVFVHSLPRGHYKCCFFFLGGHVEFAR